MTKIYRAAIIGRTGRGNYGHNLDLAAKSHPRLEAIAVADENAEGRKRAADRLQLRAVYEDHTKMLAAEKPDIVVIAPRWVDCHLEMAMAALESHASVFLEKPMARTLAECDRILDAADRVHARIVVAHNMRVCPILDYVQRRIREGLIGEMQEIRGRGKEDTRAGGEDMMVLGTHTFDLMRRFGGDPQWAVGRVTVQGRDITPQDVNADGPEGLGPIAGDAIAGMFGFAGGVSGYFATKRSSDVSGTRWGIDIYGSKGVVAVRADHVPKIFVSNAVHWTEAPWKPLEIPSGTPPQSQLEANQLLVSDLVEAMDHQREPQSGGRGARWAIEMAHALYASQESGGRVRFPMERREHPLSSIR